MLHFYNEYSFLILPTVPYTFFCLLDHQTRVRHSRREQSSVPGGGAWRFIFLPSRDGTVRVLVRFASVSVTQLAGRPSLDRCLDCELEWRNYSYWQEEAKVSNQKCVCAKSRAEEVSAPPGEGLRTCALYATTMTVASRPSPHPA